MYCSPNIKVCTFGRCLAGREHMRDEKGRDRGEDMDISGRVIFKADHKEIGHVTLYWIHMARIEASGRLL